MLTPPENEKMKNKDTDLKQRLTNIHGARATDSLPAGPPEGQAGVHLVLDLDQGVQHLNRKRNSEVIYKLYMKRMRASLEPPVCSPWARSC